jgi:hypothetical protein
MAMTTCKLADELLLLIFEHLVWDAPKAQPSQGTFQTTFSFFIYLFINKKSKSKKSLVV